jgi:hypothetical protein
MSLHASLLMIKGDHLNRIEEILTTFNYRLTGTVEHIDSWSKALDAMTYPRPGKSRDIVYKVGFVHNGWTVILDPEMVVLANEDACAQTSQTLGSPVFGMVCEGTSNSYGYSFYDGKLVRAFWVGDGDIFDNRGDELLQEDGIDLDDVSEDSVLKVMDRLGVNYADFEKPHAFQAFELDESHIGVSVKQPIPLSRESRNRKPWWRFW